MQLPLELRSEKEAKAELNKKSAEMRLEAERQELLNNISSSSVNKLRDKVASILNDFPETRDSDVALQIKFWELFEDDIYNGRSITPEDYRKLTQLTSIVRERARIQNQYKLFVASPKIRKARGTLSEEEKKKALEDKPEYPRFIVYFDDSGKTGSHLLVGSVWLLVGGFQNKTLSEKIREFRKLRNFYNEFHFVKMTKDEMPIYIEFIQMFLAEANAISFKIMNVPKAGISNVQDAFENLYYHLLIEGVEQENRTGRAPLPRSLQVWKDAEQPGPDQLLVANLKDRLKQASITTYKDQLAIGHIFPVNSKDNPFIQVADLLVGSVNRTLNRTSETPSHKDEFAAFLLGELGIDPFALKPNTLTSDKTAYISLGSSE